MRATSGQAAHPAVLRVFQTRDQTRAFYNKISRVYDLLAERSEAPARRAGVDLIGARRGEKLLEVGFGTGHSVVRLAKAVRPNGLVFGLALSDQMLKQAKAGAHGARSPAVWRCGSDAIPRAWHRRGVYELHAGAV